MNKSIPVNEPPDKLSRISSNTSSSYGNLTSHNSFISITLSRQSSILSSNNEESSEMLSSTNVWHTVPSTTTLFLENNTLNRQNSDTSYGEINPNDNFANIFHENHNTNTNDITELNPRNIYNTGVILTIQIPDGQYTVRAENFTSPGTDYWSITGSSFLDY